MMTAEQIAPIVQEANRAYCLALGDDSQKPWADAPEWQKASVLLGVDNIISGKVTSPEQSHAEWLLHKSREGWQYGAVKNEDTKEHPCFLPYDRLPADQKIKDALFFAIVNVLKG